jgi:antitoxin PrlF
MARPAGVPPPASAPFHPPPGPDTDYIVLTKARLISTEEPFATFGEWDGGPDQQAYRNL